MLMYRLNMQIIVIYKKIRGQWKCADICTDEDSGGT